MKKIIFIVFFLSATLTFAANRWPREITLKSGGKVTIYQPQPESLAGDTLKSRAAISVKEKPADDLIFGVVWSTAVLNTDRESRSATLESIKVTDLKFPDEITKEQTGRLITLLETEVLKWNLEIHLDEIIATLESDSRGSNGNFKNDPPQIYYATVPSALILIDGTPVLQDDKDLGMKRVVNTPFIIVQSDNSYFLYGGKFWYQSDKVDGGYKNITKLPAKIDQLNKQIQQKAKESGEKDGNDDLKSAPEIIISTKPAELIQSEGEAKFTPVEGTQLLYVSNSSDNIFMDVQSQQYFILVSGRWYKAKQLTDSWTYVNPETLPKEFAKIPEGSEKDVVLASVPGTDAAREAVVDAQVPQTAKVDRSTATCTVTYDGNPKFEAISGTSMEVAVNTSSTVLKANGKYYAVDKGVWFASPAANGPWTVSDERPSEVDKIPADNQAYNVKYVYIYETTPQYVYVGYTPGYMGCYVYGPTVVYGTGYYYNPWMGSMYYPRPVTYGFNMHYNPYTGWSMSFSYNVGIFHFTYGGGYGGWWGPPVYRPPYYHYPYNNHHHGGYYGPRTNVNVNNNITINNNRNNIYNQRKDVVSRDKVSGGDRNRPANGTRPGNNSNRPASKPSASPNNVFSDRQGNVYQKDNSGNFQQRDKGKWQNAEPSRDVKDADRMRSRSNDRVNSSQNFSRPASSPASRPSPSARPAPSSRPSPASRPSPGGRR